MEYTAVIRTLGRAGVKYQSLLDSLIKQSIRPAAIIVYIAEGYAIPKESVGVEEYVIVKKGMVAQRALRYDEVHTEYMLFLDDDVFLSEDSVERMYNALLDNDAQVISPDTFDNAKRSFLGTCLMTVSGRMLARRDDGKWAYKVMRNSGYSYNSAPSKDIYLSQTNAGPCFFMKKNDFLKIHFEEELWLDRMPYALGEDEVMFYKMYKMGLKQLTFFNSGVKHLDAGSTMLPYEKEKMLIGSDFYFKVVFWHRFIYAPEGNLTVRLWSMISLGYALLFTLFISIVKMKWNILKIKWNSIRKAFLFIRSREYKSIPLIK